MHKMLFGSDRYLPYFPRLRSVLHMFLLEHLNLHQEEHQLLEHRVMEHLPVGHQLVKLMQNLLVPHRIPERAAHRLQTNLVFHHGQVIRPLRLPHQILEQATHRLQTNLVFHHGQGIRHLQLPGTHRLQTLE